MDITVKAEMIMLIIIIIVIVIEFNSFIVYLGANLTTWKPIPKLALMKYKQTHEDTEHSSLI
jgi:hypothetical protein